MERYEKLKTRAITTKAQIKSSYDTARELKAQYASIVESLKRDKESYAVQTYAQDTFKELMDKLSQQHVERLANMLTYALQTIFYDKQYSLEFIVSDKRSNKALEPVLVERKDSGAVLKSSFDDAVGGGILAVVGLVTQVYYISVFDLAPFIFLDEALTQVSSEYLPTLMEFIRELADKRNLIMVLISHDDRIISYADKSWRIDQGHVEEVKHGRNVKESE